MQSGVHSPDHLEDVVHSTTALDAWDGSGTGITFSTRL